MTKVAILGAAGQVSGYLIKDLLKNTHADLNLLARNAKQRLNVTDPKREHVFDGDFNDEKSLLPAIKGADYVYVDNMSSPSATKTIVKAMDDAGTKRIICMNILGTRNEVPGKFGKWNEMMIGPSIRKHTKTAKIIENSDLIYTNMRVTWLYNKDGDTKYEVTAPGEPLKSAQITRQAVAKFICDLIQCDKSSYQCKSIGLGEPNTYFDKPSFY
ncbi:NAD(P)H-binding protein [uncultured bacterium]|nr:NAD(P)H-binding protein [uncultured bacterium]